MKVIFLDIDGVLNRKNWGANKTGWMENEKVVLIAELCKVTEAKIVLASNWRETWFEPMLYECKETVIYLGHQLFEKNGLEIIGVTDRAGTRGDEIKKYLTDHPEVTNYVSIDDAVVEVDNAVRTDSYIGLTEDDCKKAIQFLSLPITVH